MLGFLHLKKQKNIFTLSMIKTEEQHLIKLNSNAFISFSKNYSMNDKIGFIEIIEMDDDFIEYISDIDLFITTNANMIDSLIDIVDTYAFLDNSNTKSIDVIAKEYKIKLDPNKLEDNEHLVKAVLMAYKKKEYDKNISTTVVSDNASNENIPVQDIMCLRIGDLNITIDTDEDKIKELSINAEKMYRIFCQSEDTDTDLNSFIKSKFKDNNEVFFKLLKELEDARIIEEANGNEIRNNYYNLNKKDKYQNYLLKSLEKGINAETLKEQLNLLILKGY
ncbi:hypothetical protein [Aliarcobacter butzleri]|uniref:hypothetical protein n=1 Tax=Aliarcobacter butzleri TaxID=28197 RepID=UPI001269FCAE|nr:hypothetical protein [Aliarcobacter butzleri]